MNSFNYLIWSQDPEIFKIPLSFIGLEDRPVVWYGLLFALGFIVSQQIFYRIFTVEGRDPKDVDKLTTYMVLATIVGSRLGHCLFYNPGYYLSNPMEILKIWEGGLASHGGAIGILIAIFIFAKFNKQYTWFWTLDRLAIITALTGAFIRTGNLMNSEMEGVETKSNYGIVYARGTEEALSFDDNRVEEVTFAKGGPKVSNDPGRHPVTATIEFKRGVEFSNESSIYFIENNLRRTLLSYSEVVEHIDFGKGQPLSYRIYEKGGRQYVDVHGIGIARHAAQIYEAIYCLIIMVILFWLWKKKRDVLPDGFIFGLFMTLLWTMRFIDEFFKMNQEAFEENLTLNMGQWLSIPMALFGVGVMVYTLKAAKKKAN